MREQGSDKRVQQTEDREKNRNKRSVTEPGGFMQRAPATFLYFYLPAAFCS